MDISSRFSLVDFLAYLFPGMVSTLGLYTLLLLTPLKDPLTRLDPNLTFVAIFLAISYIIGVLQSGISEIYFRRKQRFSPGKNTKASVPLTDYQGEIINSFHDFMGISGKKNPQWSITNFYICRSLVIELMPKAGDLIHRQSSLRQLRLNLIPALIIWCFVGIGWGAWNIINQLANWGILLILVSIFLTTVILVTLLDRMETNEAREVREVLTAFLAGYRAGLFEKKEKPEKEEN